MAGWRDRVTKVLKEEIAATSDSKELREMGNVLSSLQPYEPEGAVPMPVKVVSSKKWRRKKGKAKTKAA